MAGSQRSLLAGGVVVVLFGCGGLDSGQIPQQDSAALRQVAQSVSDDWKSVAPGVLEKKESVGSSYLVFTAEGANWLGRKYEASFGKAGSELRDVHARVSSDLEKAAALLKTLRPEVPADPDDFPIVPASGVVMDASFNCGPSTWASASVAWNTERALGTTFVNVAGYTDGSNGFGYTGDLASRRDYPYQNWGGCMRINAFATWQSLSTGVVKWRDIGDVMCCR